MQLRAIARQVIPYEARLRYKLWRRALADRRERIDFAERPPRQASGLDNLICEYARLIVDYEGQEEFGAAKRHNLALLASQLNHVVIRPDETFSVWRHAGRPSEAQGYKRAAGLRNRRLISDVGGSTCLLSTVLYNVALLGGLEIVERHCHSVDVYGEERYFELGRDATIEYGYLDLRFRNRHGVPVMLSAEVNQHEVRCGLYSAQPHGFMVEVAVDDPETMSPGESVEPGKAAMKVTARRRIVHDTGLIVDEAIPESLYHALPADAKPDPITASLRPSL
ncbi:MAG TPA: VanW family protein [Dehalococcoidia bacterium]|nr:VanW family protein [Dehalococcoidia bacterium]